MTTHEIKTRVAIEPRITKDARLELYSIVAVDVGDTLVIEGPDGTWLGEVSDVEEHSHTIHVELI